LDIGQKSFVCLRDAGKAELVFHNACITSLAAADFAADLRRWTLIKVKIRTQPGRLCHTSVDAVQSFDFRLITNGPILRIMRFMAGLAVNTVNIKRRICGEYTSMS